MAAFVKTEGGVALPAPAAASPSPALLAEVKKDVEDLIKEEPPPLDESYEPRPGPEFEDKEIEGVSFFSFF